MIILFVFILNEDNNEENPEKISKFAHFFDGVSPNKKSRMYIAIIQIRRAIFVILLINIAPVSTIIVLSFLVGLQIIYFTFLIIMRPYKLIKYNIIEIINEMYFFTILASLLKFNSIASWEGTPTTIYTWFISSNNILILIIISGKLYFFEILMKHVFRLYFIINMCILNKNQKFNFRILFIVITYKLNNIHTF